MNCSETNTPTICKIGDILTLDSRYCTFSYKYKPNNDIFLIVDVGYTKDISINSKTRRVLFESKDGIESDPIRPVLMGRGIIKLCDFCFCAIDVGFVL